MEGLYILLGAFILIGVALVAFYVLHAMALYRLAANAGMNYPVLAWVPVARYYVLGYLCDRAAFYRTGKRRHFAVSLPVIGAVGSAPLYFFLSEFAYDALGVMNWDVASGVQSFLGFLAWALTTFALYNLYCDYAPGKQDTYTILSAFFAAVAPAVCLYLIRWNVPLSVRAVQSPPGYQPPPDQPPPPPGFENQSGQKKF